MGQAESLSISGGDGYRYWVSIKAKPVSRGRKKTIYKGVLLGPGPRQGERVVVKAFTDISGSRNAWAHEVSKADVAHQLVTHFLNKHPLNVLIRIVLPGIVEMDKVSKFENWWEERFGGRVLQKDEWISIEENIIGQFCRYCPWSLSHEHNGDPVTHCDLLQTFSHFTYMHSCGEMVACDFQGVSRMHRSGKTLYIVTDSILHSRHKLYGMFDEGLLGITEFFKLHKCTDICQSWPKPCPLTPPPTFDEACAQLLNNITPPPTFTDIVFPSYQHDEPSQSTGIEVSGRRRHASERHRRPREGARSAQAEMSHDTNCLDESMNRRRHASERRPQQNLHLQIPVIDDGLRRRSHSNAGESLEQYLEQHRRRSSMSCNIDISSPRTVNVATEETQDSGNVNKTSQPLFTLYPDLPPAYESVCGVGQNQTENEQVQDQQLDTPMLQYFTDGTDINGVRAQDSVSNSEHSSSVSRRPLQRSSTLPYTETEHPRIQRSSTLCTSNPSLEVRNGSEENSASSQSSLLQRRVNTNNAQGQTEFVSLVYPPTIQLPQPCCLPTLTTNSVSPSIAPSATALEQDEPT